MAALTAVVLGRLDGPQRLDADSRGRIAPSAHDAARSMTAVRNPAA
ncbi:hypothetical protein ACFWOJ_11420 [Streptomyces sp. NPDC058439]